MKFDKSKWKELDINTAYGLLVREQKVVNMKMFTMVILCHKFQTKWLGDILMRGGIVLDMFMESGTTLFECETLGRNYIGFDINDEIINYVESKMGLASATTEKLEN